MKFSLLSAASAVFVLGLPVGNCYSTQKAKTKTKEPHTNEGIIKSVRFRGLEEDEVPDSDYLIQLGDEFVEDFDSVALSDDGFTVAFGSESDVVMQVFQYDSASDEWIQLGSSITETGIGYAVALSADGSILAGSDYNFDYGYDGFDLGVVKVFQFSNGDWSQIGSDLLGEQSDELCGISLDLNAAGDIVAFGCYNYYQSTTLGRVRVYQFSNGEWSQIGSDLLGEQDDEECGSSLSLSGSGDVVAFGCGDYDGDGIAKGRARVFQFANGVWSQIGLDIIGEDDKENFAEKGLSLSSSGDILAGGTGLGLGLDNATVRVFQLSNGAWSQIGSNIFPDIDSFGSSLALSSDATTLIAGIVEEGEALVYTYSDSGNNWVQRGQKLSIKEGKSTDIYRDVAISADGMIVSTVYDDGAKVYTFPTPSSSPSMAMTTKPSAVPSVTVQPLTGPPVEETSLFPTLSSEDPSAAPTAAIFGLGVYVVFLLIATVSIGSISFFGFLLYWLIG
eukprot:CAMPEP_0178948642 /NCGR_PEP_ID=MMETSP0789-20121207/5593_1 /TAXON_ID=3005 /ORGANISM="Rhizosolenia setigera, Strain CCMP 1694" /LENGTH=503 /DNA_ID=CAMNT_0020629045 /DNA_START=1918 /DNA_END=3429 /DNA_ORIENTATION=+